MNTLLKACWLCALMPVITCNVSAKELFHFDFKGCNGKYEMKSGDFTLKSNRVPLLEQKDALRLAPVPDITISGPIPDMTKQYSFSAWVLLRGINQCYPIVSRGEFGDALQFAFTAGPEFYTLKKYTKYGTAVKRLNSYGTWHHLTAVYNNGEYIIYVNGKPFDRKKVTVKPQAVNEPLRIGVIKHHYREFNYKNANMLLNDLYLFDHALSEAEVAQLFQKARSKYPKGNQAAPGSNHHQGLPTCFHYAFPGSDPGFERELEIVKNYKPQPFAKQKPLNDIKIVGSPDSTPRIIIDNKEFIPYMNWGPGGNMYGGKNLRLSGLTHRDFGAAGMPFRRFAVHVGNVHPSFDDMLWLGDGNYDFRVLDERLESFFQADPEAMVNIILGANYTPVWFRNLYPDECAVSILPNGKKVTTYAGQIGSDIFKAMLERYLTAVVKHIEKSPYAKRIYAYTVGGGNSWEWYWSGTFLGGFPGYSKATEKLFRKYLAKRYKTDEALQKAWNNKNVTLATATVPMPEMRKNSETLFLRDPEKAMAVIDFRNFISDRTFECIEGAAKVVKEASGYKKIVTTWSGYSFGNHTKDHYSGMNNYGKVVRSPYIDSTHLAILYNQGRMPGGSGMGCCPYNGTSILHGKLYWLEADLRSNICETSETEWTRRHSTYEETATMIERNSAVAITRNTGVYDLPCGDFSSYHNDKIMNAVKNAAEMFRVAEKTPRKTVAEVAIVFDETSSQYWAFPQNTNITFFNYLTYFLITNFTQAAVPADFYTLDDLAEKKMRDYKLYIFLNPIAISDERKEMIYRKLAKNKAAAVWCHAPGFIKNDKFDLKNMENVTGIPFAVDMKEARLTMAPSANSAFMKYEKALPAMSYGPIFVPQGKKQIVHATANGKPAIVEYTHRGSKMYYSLAPLTPAMLRGVAEANNIHVYLNTFDQLSVNSDFLHIHAKTTGEKTVYLPGMADVYEVLSGKKVFSNVKEFKVNIKQFENRFYQLKYKK